ncbi:GNS1/SUR4-like fatty acid elongation protein [Hamiltosporidium magnivora]|uniref:Elongation of fatty acids protein n=1 Tax=Hamiltosporidium magnivora TaxID=148818 RepID=A0A4Q9L9N6_9MICR|nr:GNS1/SUR4-like fatty acid elongation protein [Hamiltosporidium magnivora]TBU09114.1 GNS1/SUR4-like fatty acid elongation protein [Hamiltosporidium magnivora]
MEFKDKFDTFIMDWKTPVISSFLYMAYVQYENKRISQVTPPQRKKFSLLTLMMVLHNLILCVFSGIVFYKTYNILLDCYKKSTFYNFLNDGNKFLYKKMIFWTKLFYLSKYYEIIDTIILHVNKKRTSFLQMYHHAGAIICCWMLAKCESHVPWIFVVLNSFVHTIMYAYYSLTCLGIKTKYKHLITKMQMTQFVMGNIFILIHIFKGDLLKNENIFTSFKVLVLLSNVFYVAVLFGLFNQFSKQTYSKRIEERKKPIKNE